MCKGYLEGTGRCQEGARKEVSEVCQENFKVVSKIFKGVLKKFQGCFKIVLRVFQSS